MTDWIPDASSIACFRENPRRFQLKYRQHLVSAKREEAVDSGRAAHVALDYWFSQAESHLDGMLAALRGTWGEEPLFHEGLERPLELFERILTAYAERYPREQDPFSVVETESHFKVHIERAGVAFDWCGIKDRTIQFTGGDLAVMDSKTTSAWFHTAKTEGFFDQYMIGEQQLGYVAAEQAAGRDVRSFYIDAIHVDTKYGKVVPERDFRRWQSPPIMDWQLDRWARDIWHTLSDIYYLDDSRGPNEPWPLYTNLKFNKRDEYWDFYTMAPELHADVRLGYREEQWRPWEGK